MGATGRHKRRRPSSPAEQKDQLRRANQVRVQRAALRQQMKHGQIDGVLLIAGHYDELEDVIAGWRIGTVIRCIPKIGPMRADEILRVFGKLPHTRLGKDLTFAQRKVLAELCREATEVVVGLL